MQKQLKNIMFGYFMEKTSPLGTDQKVAKKYYCDLCDYITYKKINYEKHLQTDKHQTGVFKQMEIAKVAKVAIHHCPNCELSFKTKSGLWKHSKKCVTDDDVANTSDEEIVNINDENISTTIRHLICKYF